MKYILILITCLILLSACLDAETVAWQNANIKALETTAKELAALQKTYKDLKAKFLTGGISMEDFTKVSIEVTDKIKNAELVVSQVKGDIEKQRESGIGWFELIVSAAIAFGARGLPSKGPLGMFVNAIGLRKKEG